MPHGFCTAVATADLFGKRRLFADSRLVLRPLDRIGRIEIGATLSIVRVGNEVMSIFKLTGLDKKPDISAK